MSGEQLAPWDSEPHDTDAPPSCKGQRSAIVSNAQPEQSGHGEAATMPAGEAYPMCLMSTTSAGSRMDQYGVSTLRLMAVEEELRLLSANEARLRWQQLRAKAARLAWQEALVSRLHAQREHRSQHSEPTGQRPTQPSRPWSAFASVAPRLVPSSWGSTTPGPQVSVSNDAW